MRTLLLVGIAALAALAADQALAHNGQTSTRTVRVIHAGSAEDAAVYSSDADRAPTEGDYRGRWQGQWNGTWEDAEGRRYNGTYEGEYDAGANAAADARRPGPRSLPAEYRDGGRRISADCDARGESVIGTVAGGAIGGAIGNRVAGRGNRTIGTVVGAGVGAVAGGAIGNAAGRADCERQERVRTYRHGGQSGGQYYGGSHSGGYESYSSSSGYSGYEGGQVIVIPGQPIIIEETETTYETVVVEPRRTRVAPRPRVVHHRRPIRRAAARCSCR